MENKSFMKESVTPVIVLLCICLITTLALAAVHAVAQPTIDANQQKAADEARMEVLPEGDSFTKYDGKLVGGVTEAYIADNKAGMAVTAEYKGFGGAVTVMTGIDANGAITGVKVTSHNETPGLGTKAADPTYLEQYKGVTDATAGHINDDANVDAVTGATITSNAVYGSVVEALAQYKECGGVK